VDDPPLRERLAQSGLATARRFTWKRSAETFIAFLRALPEPAPRDTGLMVSLAVTATNVSASPAPARLELRFEPPDSCISSDEHTR